MSGEINQNQKAGANSQQTQIQNLTIINGIDEKRAREICDEKFDLIRKEFSSEALQIANERVSKFEDSLIPKMKKIDGALESFSDPAFQYLISKAHKTAACTDRDSDYDLLSELLIHHVKNKNERKVKTSIGKAVEIIDQIDDDALCGLTVIHGAMSLFPKDKKLENGLQILEGLFEKLIYDALPTGYEWVDNLEILGAIRISPVFSNTDIIPKYAKYFSVDAYTGIKKDSENYQKAMTLLSSNGLPISFLQPNELNDDYVRLPALNENDVDNLMWVLAPFSPQQKKMIPTAEQIAIFHQIWKMYDNSSVNKAIANKNFEKKFLSFNNLLKLNNWWKSINHNFSITAVGQVIAHANAQRLESSIPPLK